MSDAFHDAGESYGFSMSSEGNVTKDDPVIPDHYNKQCSLSCIQSMVAVLGITGTFYFCLGSCYKYLWRFKNKNGKEDLMKVSRYLHIASDFFIKEQDKMAYDTPEFLRMVDLYNTVCYSTGEYKSVISLDEFIDD